MTMTKPAATKPKKKSAPAQVKKHHAEAVPKSPLFRQLQDENRASEARHLQRHREEMSTRWSELTQSIAEDKAREAELLDPSRRIVIEEHANPYPVVGKHSGVWAFKTYRVLANGRCIFNIRSHLPDRNGKQSALTADAAAMILDRVATDTSYRSAGQLCQQLHPESPMEVTTIRNTAERHGEAMDSQCQAAVATVGPVEDLPDEERQLAEADPAESSAWIEAIVPEKLQEEARHNPVAYPAPEETLEAAVDAVCVKRQTPTRSGPEDGDASAPEEARELTRKERSDLKEAAGERKTCSTACGTITFRGRHLLTLAANGYLGLTLAMLAAIRHNRASHFNLCILVDGEKSLAESLQLVLVGKVKGFQIVLDWWHLRKRIGEQLSLALNNKEIRKEHWKALQAILWHGCVDAAIAHLRGIDPAHIKNLKAIETLIGYLEARRAYIPVYSVRQELGLKVSSNAAEKTCDLLVSRRQKRQGMAWSQEGSFTLAMIRACLRNQRLHSWLKTGQWSLDFVSPAA